MELQKHKSKVSSFRDFPRTVGFDGLGLCSRLSGCCCLCAGLQGLNGVSIMVSVVLRSTEVWGPVALYRKICTDNPFKHRSNYEM